MKNNTSIALITGAGTGIGRATAVAFAKAGAHGVVLAGRRLAELEQTAALVEAAGSKPLVIKTDVTSETEVKGLIAHTLDTFGRLDAAFNNAGTLGAIKPIWELDKHHNHAHI